MRCLRRVLAGRALADVTPTPGGLRRVPGARWYVTCLDLAAAGALFTTGFERTVQLSGAEAKERKRLINQQWIYPPLDDPGKILGAADHRASRRPAGAPTSEWQPAGAAAGRTIPAQARSQRPAARLHGPLPTSLVLSHISLVCRLRRLCW